MRHRERPTEQANFSSVCSPGDVLAPYFSAATPRSMNVDAITLLAGSLSL